MAKERANTDTRGESALLWKAVWGDVGRAKNQTVNYRRVYRHGDHPDNCFVGWKYE